MNREYEISDKPQGFLPTVRAAYHRCLPYRYGTQLWEGRFTRRVDRALAPGIKILDIGAGAKPKITPEDRPPRSLYFGMDISADELSKAPNGSYDATVVSPAEQQVPELAEQFDLCISWLVFEHVKDVDAAIRNVFSYLRPGGKLVIQMSGGFSPFSLANRLLPPGLARRIVSKTQGRDPESIFPAYYRDCSYGALSRIMREHPWADWEVEPLFVAAGYVLRSRGLMCAYIAYEEWAYRRNHLNLAPYYVVFGRRAGPGTTAT
jgi:SAM-dependent methyltransferase